MVEEMTTSDVDSAPTEIEQEREFEVIDIPLLLESNAKSSSKDGIYTEWSKCCIYRVPRKLRSVNEAAYTPQVVSIGPFHHGKPKLKAMEGLKSRYFDEFCRRTKKSRDSLKGIIDNECEQSIRACYAGTFELKKDKFVDMVVTDAGFIIELLLRSTEKHEKDYIFSKPWLKTCIEQDLILLENQLPFFVLEKIYNYAKPLSKPSKENVQESSNWDILQGTRSYFSKYNLQYTDPSSEVKHFTDLLRYYFCLPVRHTHEPLGKNRIESLRSATNLDEAGVEFEVIDTQHTKNIVFEKGRCLTHCPCFNCSWLLKCLPCFFHLLPNLKCEQPTLKLRRFEVDDTTECLFRNLMALEQCHYPNQVYVCNYVSLMDKLINTGEDVDLLIEKKVIVNYLGSSKAVAQLLNKLCEQIVEPNSCYYDCVQEINKHCNNPLNRIMATLTSVYFRDFWRGTATTVGIIVLCLTVWNIFLRHILKVNFRK
ncbi:UPF0481 protein At3g47200-like [Malania oleifera]|uniref:UPF0481 protein At3g47200-like n=1 Tax=Malania oleifera TaxID=397392 RepID=UPI0025ADEC03|nr:UPF0481 protein At3g47200-like [Malania oleifera]